MIAAIFAIGGPILLMLVLIHAELKDIKKALSVSNGERDSG